MRLPFVLFALVAVAIVAFWAWLGRPVPMPSAPLAEGEKLYCVSYAPFREGQTPLDLSTRVSIAQIEDDLARLARIANCVRTYSTDLGLDQVAEVAQRHGLTVLQGVWLSSKPERNRQEIEAAVALANRYPEVIRAVIVGNEVLLRGELAVADVDRAIREVKARVPAPVTYADVWEFWLRYPQLHDAVDFVTIHILPYWEDFPVAANQAAAHVDAIRRQVAAALPGKDILIGEVGWPSQGRMREGALPSPANQARVVQDVLALARRGDYRVNVIEAFDQPWKRRLEGTVGGHWGLLTADTRTVKFAWGQAVSNHPHWMWQAAAGVVLAGVIFVAAGIGQRWRELPPRERRYRWLAVAAMGLAPGLLIGWTAENALLESLGVGGWMRSAVLLWLTIAGPLVAVGALVAGRPLPAFVEVIGPQKTRATDLLQLTTGAVFIVLTVVAMQAALGLVFDPRYRDFAYAPITAASVPMLILSLASVPGKAPRGAAETAMAVVLGASAAYIVLNESFSNWQSIWFGLALVCLVIILVRLRGGRNSG